MSRREKSYAIDMCTGVIWKNILRFALPLVCSSVLQLLFNAADIVVVGRFAGDNSLAAVGSNGSLIHLLTNLFIGLSVGANVTAAKCFGARDEQNLGRTVHTAMLLSLVSGSLLAVVGAIGARQILIWMQSPENVLPLATVYLRIYFLGMPATMIYNFGSALLRSMGDTKRPLHYLSLAGLVNVVLNLFLVIPLHMDVAGVALATVISQTISAALILRCLIREKGSIHLDIRHLKIHKDQLKEILRVGIPAGIQGILFSISDVVIQSSVNSFGEITMAGNSAAANIEGFIYFSMNAFYQAAISFTGQNMGAGLHKRVYRILGAAQFFSIATGLLLGTLFWTFGHPLLSLYTKSPAVVQAGMIRLGIVARTCALFGAVDTMVGVLRGMGYSVMPMVVSLVGTCALRLVWISTVFQIPRFHTIEAVYIVYPITWAVTLSIHILCFLWAMRQVENQAMEHPDSPSCARQL